MCVWYLVDALGVLIGPGSSGQHSKTFYFIYMILATKQWNSYLANVKVDLSRSASNVPEVGIGHLSWPIDNTTHDSDLQGKYVYGCSVELIEKKEMHIQMIFFEGAIHS